MRIELFGNLQITSCEQSATQLNTNRLRSLLALLVLHCDSPQPREQLAFLLWPESTEAQARTNLRQLLHHMRRALPPDCSLLSVDNQTVQWRHDPSCSIDVLEFDSALQRAAAFRKASNTTAELEALEEAARLYQDDLLRGLYDEWLQPKREHYRQQLEQTLIRLASLNEENRDYPAAIRDAERLVSHDPIRETHHQRLIRLHAANHDRSSALRAYHQCLRILRRELGVEPGRETRDLYEAVRKSAPVEIAASPAMGKPAPASGRMVGRRGEWERLTACWRAASGGRTQLAVILGEPGIGKSRLAEEFYQWCTGRQEPAARARCYAAHGQLAYAPVTEWLRAEPLRTSCSRLPLSQLTELSRVLPEILTGNAAIERPGPLTESWERHHFYEALNAAFGKARKPLLLMIDDLQWCDPDSFEWLHSLFRSESAKGILVVATARPEETDRNHPFSRLMGELRQSGQAVELPLERLTADETGELAALLSGHPLDTAELAGLYGSSQGNPLFVLESLRSGLGNAAPSRIHAVIVARLAQLSPRAYELAGFAGTVGRAFSFDLLAKATDWDEESVSRALDELWQRRIIGGDQGGQYDFTHDRLREVAYAELTPVRRRFLHRRVARALEELNGASGHVAAHYEAAGMPEPAIRHYQIAAGVARQRYADAEAAGLLRRALTLCREFPEGAARDRQELELLVLLGLAMVTTQGYAMPEAGEIYERALILCRRLKESKHLFSVLSGCWSFNVVSGRLSPATALAQEFLDLAEEHPDAVPHLLPMAGHFVLGSSLFHLGRFEQSEWHLRQALEAGAGRPHTVLTLFAGPDIGVFCNSYLSQVLWHLGRVEESLQASREAIAAAAELSHPFSVALAQNYAAILHLFRGESRQALSRASEAAAVCRKYGFAYYLSMAEILAGSAQASEGYTEAGLARFREGLEALKATGAQVRLPFYHGLLAEACAQAGHTGEALAHVSIGLAFQGHSGEVWAASYLHRIHGDLLLRNGDRDQARFSYQRAIDAAREAGSRSFELLAANALAACDDFGTQVSAATERF